MPVKKSLIWKILLGIYLAGLFFSCLWNFKDGVDLSKTLWNIPTDKIVHFALFLPFPIICHSAFPKWNRSWWFLPAVLLLGVGIGAGIEGLQGLSEYRSQDVMDFLADCVGLGLATAGIIIYEIIRRRRENV